ncbi:5-formyltetrahydrofolate cyclo-ligase [Methylacidimicrobium sp. AP8]|uniref:5-formyltetrahydrofolate cyclo-ligase n=1 Tax=Methylacidimicrobium sp. AP8 TaxID=2730359 RepID=UPI001921F205|nr:5-formyltetrahydrofolate cyclo-ligase [Methylacidimicrobium sp. AP8]
MIGLSLPEKEEQRRLLRRLLAAAGEEERAAASRRIAERLLALPEWQAARVVALYASFPSEPDTDFLFERARAGGKRVLYPFHRGAGRSLGFAEVEAIASLRSGPLGFREPPPRAELRKPEAGLVLVPGLGFDRRGTRLGRGGGYYDRTLAELGPGALRVGLFFSCQELPQVASDGHDQRLDLIVTEEETIRSRRG